MIASPDGTKLYVFGGCGESGRLADLHSFCTESMSWTALSLEPPPGLPGRGGAGFLASSDGGSLFVVGGFIGSESNAMYRFDLSEGAWYEVLPEGNDAIRPFSVSSGATLGDLLVFFGGEVEESAKGHEGAGGFSDALLVLDGRTGEVVSLDAALPPPEPRPVSRGWADAAAWGDSKLVLFGGLSGTDEAPLRLNDTWVLHRS